MTISDFIALQADDRIREILEEVYRTIRVAIPDAEECISWNMPTFKNTKGKNVIHFAPAKKHLGIYPGPIDDVLAILIWFASNRNSIGIERKGTDADVVDVD